MSTLWRDPLFTYDDLLLIPQHSCLSTRKEAITETAIGDTKLNFPMISANMDTVTGVRMAIAMWKAGGLGILHRFYPPEQENRRLSDVQQLVDRGVPREYIYTSIGVGGKEIEWAEKLVEAGAGGLCLDIAHAHSELTGYVLKQLQHLRPHITIIGGNVATPEGAIFLAPLCDAIKVGIGPGSRCTTRSVTGHGVPQAYAIHSIRRTLPNKPIIADGGLKTSGDIAKALALGATAVMSGSMLAPSTEAEGTHYTGQDGRTYKVYRGMASKQAMEKAGRQPRAAEGVSAPVLVRGTVSELMSEWKDGLQSALSYSGCMSITEFREDAILSLITPTTLVENGVRL